MISNIVKYIFKQLPIRFQNQIKFEHRKHIIRKWKRKGKIIPPPHEVKQLAIEYYQKLYHCNILIETGTASGDMVLTQKDNFVKIYSIELDPAHWQNAVKKFESYKHIEILQGDSGKVLNDIMPKINSQAIFWLDGHYSGAGTARGKKDTPIYAELEAILKSKGLNHILLIDDARCFVGKGDYPTIEELTKYIQSREHRYKVSVEDDIIRCVIG